MNGRAERRWYRLAVTASALLIATASARAELDIGDRGPVLSAGRVRMRVTNAGILGNAFYDRGLSNDPSFEFTAGSNNDLLDHAELWVGAIGTDGVPRVFGGTMWYGRWPLGREDTLH